MEVERSKEAEVFLHEVRRSPEAGLGKMIGLITKGLKYHLKADMSSVFVFNTERQELFKACYRVRVRVGVRVRTQSDRSSSRLILEFAQP